MKEKKKKKTQKSVIKKDFSLLKKIISFCCFIFLIAGAVISLSYSIKTSSTREVGVLHEGTILLPEGSVAVEIANTEEKMERGLSGRKSMQNDEGMLFVFAKSGQYPFWMKDMKFPLDIVWISDEGRVVNIVESALPNSYPKKKFTNDAFAKYVLEMNAGMAKKYGLYLGTSVGLSSTLGK